MIIAASTMALTIVRWYKKHEKYFLRGKFIFLYLLSYDIISYNRDEGTFLSIIMVRLILLGTLVKDTFTIYDTKTYEKA